MTSGKRRRTPTSILSDMEFNEEHIDSANGPRDACVVGRFALSICSSLNSMSLSIEVGVRLRLPDVI